MVRLQKHAYVRGGEEVKQFIAAEKERAAAEMDYLMDILEKIFGEEKK
jgi:hypothetical protein